MKHIAIIFT